MSSEMPRRTFLQAAVASMAGVTAGVALPGIGFSQPQGNDVQAAQIAADPILRMEVSPTRAMVPVLSWDTEGGGRANTNLLRKNSGITLRMRSRGEWRESTALPTTTETVPNGVHYRLNLGNGAALVWRITTSHGAKLEMTLRAEGATAHFPEAIEIVVPFDPSITSTTVLPALWREGGSFDTPLLISAPDFGQMLLQVSPPGLVTGRLEGNRTEKTVNLILDCPGVFDEGKYLFELKPVRLNPPAGLQDQTLWPLARRGWFNAFQPCSAWGDASRPFSAPAGLLANNVISDPCSQSIVYYSDLMMWTPSVAEGISAIHLVRQTVEFWLEKRLHMNGEVVGYWDYVNFLDANTGPIIATWGHIEATNDLTWLEKIIDKLEILAEYLARRDQDHDGIVEATQSGNANSLVDPDRSCCWFDGVNHGHKDGYSNVLIYRAWLCLAELEARLHRTEKVLRYRHLADLLKAAYVPALYNKKTGWIADWRSEDGELHDYASPITNGMAVEFGLVEPELGRKILRRLREKMKLAGFKRFDLGVPSSLEPIRRSDYCQPNGFGCPLREDGTDTFQQYQNAGVAPGQTLHFLAAHYALGEFDGANRILRAMLNRQTLGKFQDGVQNKFPLGADWTTWDGKPSGYEGYFSDVYYFQLAVLLRESHFRDRYYRPIHSR